MDLLECILLKQQHLLDSQEFEANRGNKTESLQCAFAYHQLEEIKEWHECGGPNDQKPEATVLLPDVSNCDLETDTDKYIKSMSVIPREKLHQKYDK